MTIAIIPLALELRSMPLSHPTCPVASGLLPAQTPLARTGVDANFGQVGFVPLARFSTDVKSDPTKKIQHNFPKTSRDYNNNLLGRVLEQRPF